MTITTQYLAEHFEEVAGRLKADDPLDSKGPGEDTIHVPSRSVYNANMDVILQGRRDLFARPSVISARRSGDQWFHNDEVPLLPL